MIVRSHRCSKSLRHRCKLVSNCSGASLYFPGTHQLCIIESNEMPPHQAPKSTCRSSLPKPKVPYKQAREALLLPSFLMFFRQPRSSDLSANESRSVRNDSVFRFTTRADDKMPIPHFCRTGMHPLLGLWDNLGLRSCLSLGPFQIWLR